MNADGRVKRRMLLGQPQTRLQIRRTLAGADRHHVLDARFERPLDHRVAIGIELRAVEMTVGVDHFNRAPTGTSSRKPASTGLPPSSDAATIMPFDSMPRSLRGCRLATITTLRPIICSG